MCFSFHSMVRYMVLLALGACFAAGPAAAQVFVPDDPVAVDPDRADIPPPAERALSDYYDYYEQAVRNAGHTGGRAMNINTLGEVPRSSWYQPRHYQERMTKAELRRGPLRDDGPDASGPWRVTGGKSEGKSAGLTIVDESGDRYLLKFDAPGFLELSTGAEAIATRIFYALGYHVPENYLVRFTRDQLTTDPQATFVGPTGEEEPLDAAAIDGILDAVAQYPDGSYRALASRFLEGRPLGPFRYHGTRPDDGNDIFPHEMRRELRGLRVAAAWLNHDDSRSINSLDVYVEDGGRSFVRHYLIDFGTTFGGGPLGPKGAWVGREYIADIDRVLTSAATLGFAGRPWTREDTPGIPAVGRYRIEYFEPTKWKPQYRNPAFSNMDRDDAFWMAKRIAHFTDAELRALVETGRYTNPRATAYITRALIARRDKIAEAYLGHGGGFDRFAVADGHVTFADLIAPKEAADARYTVRWFAFDNAMGRRTDALGRDTLARPSATLPAADADYLVGAFARVGHPGTTEVYVRHDEAPEVVGIRRHADGLPNTVPVWTVIPDRWRAAAPAARPEVPVSTHGTP